MTTDCSLNYMSNTWKFQAQTWEKHVVYMFSPCSAKRRASDKNLSVLVSNKTGDIFFSNLVAFSECLNFSKSVVQNNLTLLQFSVIFFSSYLCQMGFFANGGFAPNPLWKLQVKLGILLKYPIMELCKAKKKVVWHIFFIIYYSMIIWKENISILGALTH